MARLPVEVTGLLVDRVTQAPPAGVASSNDARKQQCLTLLQIFCEQMPQQVSYLQDDQHTLKEQRSGAWLESIGAACVCLINVGACRL